MEVRRLKMSRSSGVVTLGYIALLNPFFIIISIILALLIKSASRSPIPFFESVLWTENGVVVSLVLAAYALWFIALIRRTGRRSVIINSRSIYVRDDRKRYPLRRVYVARSPLSAFPYEQIVEDNTSFPFSELLGRHRVFFSMGFLRWGFPLSEIIEEKKRQAREAQKP